MFPASATPAINTATYLLVLLTNRIISKTSPGSSFSELLEKFPEETEKIIEGMGEVLQQQVEKGIVQHSIVHKLAHTFFMHATPSQKVDMANHLAETVLQMLHSRAGATVGIGCVAYGTPKDRKRFVKSLKGYISKICMEPDGHMVMMSLWDLVDDTVLLRESVLKELVKGFEELLPDRYAQRVLLYLLAPESARYFPADVLTVLKADVPAGAAKKDPIKRRQELFPQLVPQLTDFCAEHPELVFVPGGADVMFEVLSKTGGTAAITNALGSHVAAVKWSDLEDEDEAKVGYTGIKRLMGAEDAAGENAGLASALASALKGNAVAYALDGGGYVVALLLQHSEASKILKGEVTKGKASLQGADESTGCKVLLNVLKKK